eukprot:CAMPEP_0198354914 /NCGR_PEP_ID=MMETSP1450-20131203/117154_1 /TAXON_ID=753684 ORGANISM="Madagascaria erythrocladiodes, Strain CCMP3234" /NCGR_SAMPLE_ID=MMETSP1450 /ASSEMBLY_ACC=CAM_ASM_001115 /LENGTH=63 /DNA_ID=CAMNT_0044061233 /DNA_START=8 /DNA_END=196 /DNA_ORIENTATION=+
MEEVLRTKLPSSPNNDTVVEWLLYMNESSDEIAKPVISSSALRERIVLGVQQDYMTVASPRKP